MGLLLGISVPSGGVEEVGCCQELRRRGGGHVVGRSGSGACLLSRHLTSAVQ